MDWQDYIKRGTPLSGPTDDGGYLVPQDISELIFLRMKCESRWLRGIQGLIWKLFKYDIFAPKPEFVTYSWIEDA